MGDDDDDDDDVDDNDDDDADAAAAVAQNFRRRENFGKKSVARRDRFRSKITKIGAILAIFEPLEH